MFYSFNALKNTHGGSVKLLVPLIQSLAFHLESSLFMYHGGTGQTSELIYPTQQSTWAVDWKSALPGSLINLTWISLSLTRLEIEWVNKCFCIQGMNDSFHLKMEIFTPRLFCQELKKKFFMQINCFILLSFILMYCKPNWNNIYCFICLKNIGKNQEGFVFIFADWEVCLNMSQCFV